MTESPEQQPEPDQQDDGDEAQRMAEEIENDPSENPPDDEVGRVQGG